MAVAPIPKINDRNEVIGETTITEAKQHNWPRRIVRVFLLNEAGQILVHRRCPDAIAFPGLWDQAACGHVDVGESAADAAAREMQEEIGVSVELAPVVEEYKPATFPENVFSYVYRGVVPVGTQLTPDPHEVAEIRWVDLAELDQWVEQHADQFVPAFVHVWLMLRDKIIDI